MARSNKSNEITKTCTRTGFTVTGTPDEIAEFFYRDKSQKDGFSPWSKQAEREYNKAYRASLDKAEVQRKRDADDKGTATFDASMKRLGARSERKSVKAKASATKPKRNTRKAANPRKASKVKVTVDPKRAQGKRTKPVSTQAA